MVTNPGEDCSTPLNDSEFNCPSNIVLRFKALMVQLWFLNRCLENYGASLGPASMNPFTTDVHKWQEERSGMDWNCGVSCMTPMRAGQSTVQSLGLVVSIDLSNALHWNTLQIRMFTLEIWRLVFEPGGYMLGHLRADRGAGWRRREGD